MQVSKYLEAVLRDQTLSADSEELKGLQAHRKDIEDLLRGEFGDCSPTIRYAGSKAKGTMIKESYDLDIACYFPHDEEEAGESLKEIRENVEKALGKEYTTVPKTSAIRIIAPDGDVDFHIDVVPGRFVDENEGDVFIHQASAEKERLKTNLEVHVEHIRDSGVTDAIRLMKLWNCRNELNAKTFVLELLVVDFLKEKKGASLATQLTHVWTEFRDNATGLTVEDPANPKGNGLSSYLDTVRDTLASTAKLALQRVEADDWEAIFGKVTDEAEDERTASLQRIAGTVSTRTKPWYGGR